MPNLAIARRTGRAAQFLAGFRLSDQISNAFRLGDPRSPSLKFVAGAGFEFASALAAVCTLHLLIWHLTCANVSDQVLTEVDIGSHP